MGLGTHERSFGKPLEVVVHFGGQYLLHKNPHCIHTLMVKDSGVWMTMTIKQYVKLASCISANFINHVRLSFLI